MGDRAHLPEIVADCLRESGLPPDQLVLELTRELVRVGVRGPLDVLGAEVAVAEQEQALERARGDASRERFVAVA